MVQATETFALGGTQVTTVVEIDLDSVWLISGDFAGIIPSGQIGFINGDVNLTGDLIVEGMLTGIDAFTLTGNGFQLLAQDGGVLNLQGVQKSSWLRWGDTPVGWQIGDRLAVTPTAVGVYVPSETTWGGSWGTRPTNSPDVTLVDGSIARPEVVNLSQTIILQNLRRIHFHDGAGVQSLKWLRVLNSGTTGVLAEYPIHFHLNGEASRGSVVEGVVVEGGKNHAFVPHGSHGITFPRCVAYNTTGVAFWWDKTAGNPANNSDDINWDDCLSLRSTLSTMTGENSRLAGFWLGSGAGNSCRRSAAVGVHGTPGSGARERSGFHWPEDVSVEEWDFADSVAHNNGENGSFTWQNTDVQHLVETFTAYRNGYADVNHGAYSNFYVYRGLNLNSRIGLVQHAKSTDQTPLIPLAFEDVEAAGVLLIVKHVSDSPAPSYHRNAHYQRVIYQEGVNKGSWIVYEDCDLQPSDFVLSGPIPPDLVDIMRNEPIRINAESIIEIFEDDVLVYRWEGGWS